VRDPLDRVLGLHVFSHPRNVPGPRGEKSTLRSDSQQGCNAPRCADQEVNIRLAL
jgi:hypothetical protein